MKNKRLIWLLCAILCLGMLAFVGCGSSEETASEEDAGTQFPITVEDNDYFTFEITDRDDLWGEYTYRITNKTDRDFTLDAEKAVVNGKTTVDVFIYQDVAAGTNAKEVFYLDEDDLSEFGEDEELTMKIDYSLFDSDYNDITSGSFEFVIPR
ncbi:MAG: hypothetical protein Q4D99_00595 [Bacillota bacterium]|nr:hypothetical protein [Bacillota bacterium]